MGVGEVRVNMRGGTPNTHPAAQAAKVLQGGYHFCFIFLISISRVKGNFLKNTIVINFIRELLLTKVNEGANYSANNSL